MKYSIFIYICIQRILSIVSPNYIIFFCMLLVTTGCGYYNSTYYGNITYNWQENLKSYNAIVKDDNNKEIIRIECEYIGNKPKGKIKGGINRDYKKNHVKNIYKDFSPEQISSKMSEMLIDSNSKIELEIIFQKVENLHKACCNHKGDWYFTGDYPTPGGNKVVNQAFINFVEGKSGRAY